jgi:hypothetical protein
MNSEPHKTPSQDSVEMPEPTVWPMVLATGIALMAMGVATNLTLTAVGLVVFVFGLGGWIANALPGRGHTHESLVEPAQRAQPVQQAAPGTVEQLQPGKVGYRFQLPLQMHPISAGIRGGIAGGFVMMAPALLYGVLSGHGIWFPVNLLVGMVFPDADSVDLARLEQFHPYALIFGIAIHAILSVGIGLIYGVLTPTLPGPGGPLLWGGVITPMAWSIASYAFIGIINPLMQEYVEWPWFIVSQIVFGLTATAVILRSQKVSLPPVGPGAAERQA